MDWVKHEKADHSDIYTYDQYLKDKTDYFGGKDSFAYTYWEVTEKFFDREFLFSFEAGGDERNDCSSFCQAVNDMFADLRGKQEKALQLYLMDHGGEIDQWPDPCFPRLWKCSEEINNGRYLFDSLGDGFVFHYFGSDYWMQSDGYAGRKDRMRLNYARVNVNYEFMTYQTLQMKRYEERLTSLEYDSRIEDAEKQVKKTQEELKSLQGSIGMESIFATLLIGAFGLFFVTCMVMWPFWYLNGLDYEGLEQHLMELYEKESLPIAARLVLFLPFLIYTLLSFVSYLTGPVSIWIGEGIAVLLFIISVKLIREALPLGKHRKEIKERIRQKKAELEMDLRAEAEAKKKLKRKKEEITASAEYLEAQRQQEWWQPNAQDIMKEWHKAWYDHFTNRYSVHSIPTMEQKERFEQYWFCFHIFEIIPHTVEVRQEKGV